MPSFKEKHWCYATGTVTWTVGFLAYVGAFSVPFWKRSVEDTGSTTIERYSGLWQHTCITILDCHPYPVIVDEPFLQASRAVSCVSLAFHCISALLIYLHNCTGYGKKLQSENKIVSYLPFISGLLGCAACALYVMVLEVEKDTSVRVEWGLILCSVASMCSTVGGVCMMTGSCVKGRREEHSHTVHRHVQSHNQPWTNLPSSSSNPPMALVAVPVSMLTPSSTQSSPQLTRSAAVHESTAGQSLPEVAPEAEVHRAAPSAPPPESFYY